jgi:hypothetical protein
MIGADLLDLGGQVALVTGAGQGAGACNAISLSTLEPPVNGGYSFAV